MDTTLSQLVSHMVNKDLESQQLAAQLQAANDRISELEEQLKKSS